MQGARRKSYRAYDNDYGGRGRTPKEYGASCMICRRRPALREPFRRAASSLWLRTSQTRMPCRHASNRPRQVSGYGRVKMMRQITVRLFCFLLLPLFVVERNYQSTSVLLGSHKHELTYDELFLQLFELISHSAKLLIHFP